MVRPLALVAALAALALTAPLHAQTQWVVDAAGSGDFTDLQPAIDAAAPGDVLLVLPGDYGAVVLTKRVSILGEPSLPQPAVASLDVQAAPSFTLAHLDVRWLHVADVPERSVIDDCRFRWGAYHLGISDIPCDLVLIENAADVVMSRCDVFGDWVESFFTCNTVRVRGGHIQIVGCTLEGERFWGASPKHGSWGADALTLEDGATAWIAGSVLRGGDGHFSGDGPGHLISGAAVYVASGASADVRGSTQHLLQGGENSGANPSFNVEAVVCGPGAGPVTVSGVTVIGFVGPCVAFSTPYRPYLSMGGVAGPGLAREVSVAGEAGSVGVLVVALAPAVLEMPWLSTAPLWLAPGSDVAMLPLAFAGQAAPVDFSFLQPPTSALAGAAVHLQAFEITPAGAIVGTNAGVIVLTW